MLLTANEAPKMGIYYIPVRANSSRLRVCVWLVVLTAFKLCVAVLHRRLTVDSVLSSAEQMS